MTLPVAATQSARAAALADALADAAESEKGALITSEVCLRCAEGLRLMRKAY